MIWENKKNIAFVASIVALLVYIYIQGRLRDAKLDEIYNKMAKSAETVQIAPGQYEKILEIETKTKNLLQAVDRTTKQGEELVKRLDRTDAKILSVTNGQVSIKEEILSLKDLKNSPRSDGSWQFDVNKKDGLIFTHGLCWSGPTVDKPSGCDLKLNVKSWEFSQVINQQEDGTWVVSAAVPPEISMKFGRTVVNPKALKYRWYEKINLTFQPLVSKNFNEGTVGFGVGYKLDSFNVSGLAQFTSAGSDHAFFGLGINWFPLEK